MLNMDVTMLLSCFKISRRTSEQRLDEDLQIDNDFRYLPINIHSQDYFCKA